jgi:hypothetical protein
MKILFVGPTLHGEVRDGRLAGASDLACRGPAAQGDVAKAVLEGATAIGLVDGRYENVAAPWHKEFLFALSEGVCVFGAGSLGALRAAECAAFGMIGVGAIFERYVSGAMVDDSDVAQLHGPAELDYLPFTEALVNIEETFRLLARRGLLDAGRSAHLCDVARTIFFKDLTFDAVLERAGFAGANLAAMSALIERHRVDLKRMDAHLLVARMRALPPRRDSKKLSWVLSEPSSWRTQIERLKSAR